jgi:hypothetical protein
MVVLFEDQSKNVQTITPHEVEFRLIAPAHPPTVPFASHATDLLDYLAGEVRIVATPAHDAPTRPESVRGLDASSVPSLSRFGIQAGTITARNQGEIRKSGRARGDYSHGAPA